MAPERSGSARGDDCLLETDKLRSVCLESHAQLVALIAVKAKERLMLRVGIQANRTKMLAPRVVFDMTHAEVAGVSGGSDRVELLAIVQACLFKGQLHSPHLERLEGCHDAAQQGSRSNVPVFRSTP
jgi:hypothetical protein